MALLFACHSHKTPSVTTTHTGPSATPSPVTFKKGDIDTGLYGNMPYRDTSSSYSPSAYVDTFSTGGRNFRVIYTGEQSPFIIERLDSGKWIVQYDAVYFENSENYDRTKDLNCDGYRDLVFEGRRVGSVFFFNPAIKAFSDTPNCDIVTMNWWLIDTARNWYCEVYPKTPVVSNLFTFKGFERVDLLRMEFDKGDGGILSNGLLFKAANNQVIKKLYLKEKADAWSFNYDSCWKKQYKYVPGFK